MAIGNSRNAWLAGSAGAFAIVFGGLTLLEGDVPKTYDDIAGIATACIGHTGDDVVRGKTYTKAECAEFLRIDLSETTGSVLRCITAPMNERTYAAFVIFAFNVGGTNFCQSSVVRRFNSGDFVGGCEALMAWNKAHVDGRLVEVRGLTNRRNYERRLCLSGLT